MTGRGGKRRGRPPKAASATSSTPNDKKFQYHLLKKPKYLQNNSRNESRFSTPSASRASSPQDSEESSRKSYSRKSAGPKKRGAPRKTKRGGHNSYVSRKSK